MSERRPYSSTCPTAASPAPGGAPVLHADTPVVGRLLIVDDEELNRDMLSRRVSRHGYTAIAAGSAHEGLDILDRVSIDLVLLDIHMPHMNGIDMLKVIRQRYSATLLPVIMLTAKTLSEDMVEALDLGANDYITKPFDLPVVLARIRAQLARCEAERALRDSEQRYALALRGTNDGIWDWKLDTGELFLSPRWNELLGSAPEATVGTRETWFARVHDDDLARLEADIDVHLAGVSPSIEVEHRMRLADGQYRWMLARGMAVRDSVGRPVRMAGSLTDITAGKVADALTGLPNRVLFMDRLERLVDYTRRCPDFHFAVLFLDLDRFKNVNDSLGHRAGDELLIQAAQRLEECLRTSDTIARVEKSASVTGHTVARMGGDEFAILLGGLEHKTDAMIVATRIRIVLEGAFELFGQDVRTSASIGIALGDAGYGCAADVLRDADTALYAAKAGGRGQCTVFDHAMRTQAVERLQLETDLRRALQQHEFRVHYQPIVSLTSGLVTGVEALVRWQHPQRGLLAAAEFITVAEETGLVVPLGFFVFEEVCRQLQQWRHSAPDIPAFTVAVNVSARQLPVPDLPEQLADIARRYDVPTSLLEIELTEQAILTSLEGAEAIVERLRGLGFRVSLDDFGTGYSSLAYLQRLPVDRLKLDRSFLHQWSTQAESTDGIIRTVVALARHLNSDVVAEGVETVEQLDRLREMHCDCAQGFYFSKAVQPDPLSRLLLSHAEGHANGTSDPAIGSSATDDITGERLVSRIRDDNAA